MLAEVAAALELRSGRLACRGSSGQAPGQPLLLYSRQQLNERRRD